MNQIANSCYLNFMDRRGRAQLDFILKYGRQEPLNLHVLDIGCSAGSLLKAFQPYASRLIGYEPDTKFSVLARERLGPTAEIHTNMCMPDEIPEASFDVVAMSHVLEHVPDPVGFAQSCLRLLKPEGSLFIEVPHETVDKVREMIAYPKRGNLHLFYFDPNILKHCLKKSGATIRNIACYGHDVRDVTPIPISHGSPNRRRRVKFKRIINRLSKGRIYANIRKMTDTSIGIDGPPYRHGIFIRGLFCRP